jgi:uncharacterized protein YndB with AHSA1/START domain
MKPQALEIKVTLQVRKPVKDVYEAIIDPAQMSNYFISDSSGRMEENKKLIWHFPEFSIDVPVHVGKVEKDKFIHFSWDGEGGRELKVEISLTSKGSEDTVVSITENGMENDEAGINWLKRNTEGWANFLACLKAYLEYGINLRKGAFDFMKDQEPAVQK